ncbi:MAG: terminase small subunit [Nitrospirota bacterium]
MARKPKKALTEKQRQFLKEFPKDLHATNAAIRAGYSAKTAAAAGCRLVKELQTYVKKLVKKTDDNALTTTTNSDVEHPSMNWNVSPISIPGRCLMITVARLRSPNSPMMSHQPLRAMSSSRNTKRGPRRHRLWVRPAVFCDTTIAGKPHLLRNSQAPLSHLSCA